MVLIVNGFFRSGTTLLWRMFRTESQSSFYEPLHPKVIEALSCATDSSLVHDTHGVELWDEYSSLDKGTRSKLVELAKNCKNSGMHYSDSSIEFLVALSRTKDVVVLQPNRASLVLDGLQSQIDAKIVHIIRRPEPVWESMIEMASGSVRLGKVRKKLHGLLFIRSFGMVSSIFAVGQIQNVSGIKLYLRVLRFLFSNSGARLEFLRVWIVVNYQAVMTVEKYDGLVLSLEKLVSDKSELRKLKAYVEPDFLLNNIELREPMKSKPWDDLDTISEKLLLNEEFRVLSRYICDD